jgi:starch phosphorylase
VETLNGRTVRTPDGFAQAFCDNLIYSRGQAVQSASAFDAYVALAYTVRDHLIDRWRKTTESHYRSNPKEHALHGHHRNRP